jgi:hypothetical protein
MRITIALLLIAAGVSALSAAPPGRPAEYTPRDVREPGRVIWFWFDDLEPVPDPGWAHGDYTAGAPPRFHVASYLAYNGDSSWWCGSFDYDEDGGYGNSWDGRLDVPPVEPTTAVREMSWGAIKAGFRDGPGGHRARDRDPIYPVLTFAYRNDTEPGYDFTYVQAESLGAFTDLNRGYDGVHSWGEAGFYLGNMDLPYMIRFRFVSDGAWSDEDGLYDSNGGAFMCDDVRVWDYYTGDVWFFDDVESGGLCLPNPPGAAGDYWHIVESNCRAYSDPHVWVNTLIDTPGFIPPGVQNWLRTPVLNLQSVDTCTTYFVIQFFTPAVDNDYWTETIWLDGVPTQLHAWWGDQCDAGYGPCAHFLGGDSITSLLPATSGFHEWAYHTNDNGAGPDVCGCAGITLDDIGFYGWDY